MAKQTRPAAEDRAKAIRRLHAMRYPLSSLMPPVSTVTVLGSAVSEDVATLDALRNGFTGFRLFCWGGSDTFGQIHDRDWSQAGGPGHAVRFTQASHWDLFPGAANTMRDRTQ